MPQKKKNPFLIFMLEKKTEVERQLRRKVSFEELPTLLYEQWQNLSEEEKHKYKIMCKGVNANREKLDSTGIPISVRQEKEETERIKLQEMRKNIKTTVDMMKTGKSLTSGHFFIINITHYVQTDENVFIPAEIGVCQFSFARGVFSTYHKILPASIPTGYQYQATLHSEATHQLKISATGSADGFEEELHMYLLKDGIKLPYVYTQKDFVESVEAMLHKFKLKSPLKVYSLDCLFQHLYSVSIREIPESVATGMLQSSEFDFAPKISCLWHQNMAPNNANYCALNYAHRWIFNMFNSVRLQDTFGIVPVKGKHYPDMGTSEIVDVLKPLSPFVVDPEDCKPIPVLVSSRSLPASVDYYDDDISDDLDFESEIDKKLHITKPLSLPADKYPVGRNKVTDGQSGGFGSLIGFGRGKNRARDDTEKPLDLS